MWQVWQCLLCYFIARSSCNSSTTSYKPKVGDLVRGYEDEDSTRTGTATPGVIVSRDGEGFGGTGRFWNCDWVGRDRARTGPGDFMRTNRLRPRQAKELWMQRTLQLSKTLPFDIWQRVVAFEKVKRHPIE